MLIQKRRCHNVDSDSNSVFYVAGEVKAPGEKLQAWFDINSSHFHRSVGQTGKPKEVRVSRDNGKGFDCDPLQAGGDRVGQTTGSVDPAGR